MPKGPQGQKRPADVFGNAVQVMRIAAGESCVLGAALLAPVLALAQTTQTDKAFVDARSGMVFPVTVGEFKRFRETLDPQGASAGYGYADRRGRIAATLIVFAPSEPSEPEFCKKYIDAGLEALRKARPEIQTMPPPEARPLIPIIIIAM